MSKNFRSSKPGNSFAKSIVIALAMLGGACAAPVDEELADEEPTVSNSELDPELQAFDPDGMESESDIPTEEELTASETEDLAEDELVELTTEQIAELEGAEPSLPELTSQSTAAIGIRAFELPFRCGQRWLGSTRSYHSPPNAVDFNHPGGDFGRRVLASAGGKVSRTGFIRGASYGRWIEIAHGNGYTTRYAHLSKRAVRYGQRVRRGQVIGRVGNSGGSSGPHLHFELRRYGNAIRPQFHGNNALFWGTRYYRSYNCR